MGMITALACLKAVAEAHGLHFDVPSVAERYGLAEAEPDREVLSAIAQDHGFQVSR